MSEPDRRSDAPHGSTAVPGTPLPGQPLADQPTEVVRTVGHDTRQDTVVSAAPAAHLSPRPPDDGDTAPTRPVYQDAPVVVRRADTLAGLLLVLAGVAAGISLLLVWVHDGGTGLDLVRDGVGDLDDPQRSVDRNSWAPPAVVFGGAALFLLGLLMFVPAKTHRFLGVLALLVTLVVAAGVLVPLADAGLDVQRWALGGWFTVAVAALGLLGALKAMLTHPKRR